MEYYNYTRKDMVDTDMADNKGRVGDNIQIRDLELTMLQQQDHLRSLSQVRVRVYRIRIQIQVFQIQSLVFQSQIRILGVFFDNRRSKQFLPLLFRFNKGYALLAYMIGYLPKVLKFTLL